MSKVVLPIACVSIAMIAGVSALAQFPEKRLNTASSTTQESESSMPSNVYVRLIDPSGELSNPAIVPKFTLSEAEWKERLSPEQFRIMRNAGTEAAFCGGLLDNKEEGIYTCAGCRLPLFASGAKFDSKTGWPSFFQPVGATNILERADLSHGMVRTEILCARCESHLGHLFPDGPKPTGLRYCLNSESLSFVATAELASIGEVVPDIETSEAVLAGGCFWCVETVFEEIDGVLDVTSGYAGGDAATANYAAVCTGQTKHAEAVRIVYDPKRVSYEKLLEIHFATHDPTTLNRQGADTGPQYRSAIFYADAAQNAETEKFIARLESEKAYSSPIVTTLEPLETFYPAEPYHQNYVCRNPNDGYVRAVAMPKVEKTQKLFK